MIRLPYGAAAVLLCLMTSVGCSVKEDRDGCPCRLVLDFSDTDTTLVKHVDLSVTSPYGFSYSDVVHADVFDRRHIIEVPRAGVSLNAFYCLDGVEVEGGTIEIPLGQECPQVYMCSANVDTGCEIVSQVVRLHKNHCMMTVQVEDEYNFDFDIVVRGNVNGYLLDGAPSAGDFACKLKRDQEGWCRVSVPRQTDSSLVLEITDGTEVMKVFALGEYVIESGFDWNAPDLGDIIVGIDYALARLVLTVRQWDSEYSFEVVI